MSYNDYSAITANTLGRSKTDVSGGKQGTSSRQINKKTGKLDVIQDVEEDSSIVDMRSTLSDKGRSSTYISSTGEDDIMP